MDLVREVTWRCLAGFWREKDKIQVFAWGRFFFVAMRRYFREREREKGREGEREREREGERERRRTWEGKPKTENKRRGEGKPMRRRDIRSTYMYMYHAINRRGGVCIVLNTVLLPAAVRWCGTARSVRENQYSV